MTAEPPHEPGPSDAIAATLTPFPLPPPIDASLPLADADDDQSHHHAGQAAARNTVALLVSRVFIAGLGWAGTVLMARTLSPQEWGQYSFVFGLLGLLAVITDLGVGRVVLARLLDADEREVSLVSASFIALRAVLGLLGYVAAVAYVWIRDYDTNVVQATAIAGLVVVVATPSHALTLLFQSRLKLTLVAIGESTAQAIQLLLTIFAVMYHPTLLILTLPAVANELISAFFKITGIYRGLAGPRPAMSVELRRWKDMLIEAVPLSIGFALVTILLKIDIVILSHLEGFDAVGLYSVGYKFADLAQTVTLAIVTPLTTLLVASWPGAIGLFRSRVRTGAVVLAVIGATEVGSFWASSPSVLGMLYGERFSEAGMAANLLLASTAVTAITHLGLLVLVSAGRHRMYPWLALGALAVNVALNYLLVPHLSYNGSAVATVVTEALLMIAIWLAVKRTLKVDRLLPIPQLTGIVAVAAVVIGVGVIAINQGVPWIVVAAVSAVTIPLTAHLCKLTLGITPRSLIGK